MNTKPSLLINRYLWLSSAVLGSVIAVSGIVHGIFEILQGTKITETFVIQSLGPEYQRWLNGEEAFTLLPNFLITGIAAVCVSCIIIFWSIKYLDKPFGPPIFLLLYTILSLVGGGIVHILFFLPVWIFSRWIRKEISWRSKSPDSKLHSFLLANWIYFLSITCLLYISALHFSIFGLNGASDDTIMTLIYSQLLLGLISLFLTFSSAISRDIQALSYSKN